MSDLEEDEKRLSEEDSIVDQIFEHILDDDEGAWFIDEIGEEAIANLLINIRGSGKCRRGLAALWGLAGRFGHLPEDYLVQPITRIVAQIEGAIAERVQQYEEAKYEEAPKHRDGFQKFMGRPVVADKAPRFDSEKPEGSVSAAEMLSKLNRRM